MPHTRCCSEQNGINQGTVGRATPQAVVVCSDAAAALDQDRVLGEHGPVTEAVFLSVCCESCKLAAMLPFDVQDPDVHNRAISVLGFNALSFIQVRILSQPFNAIAGKAQHQRNFLNAFGCGIPRVDFVLGTPIEPLLHVAWFGGPESVPVHDP